VGTFLSRSLTCYKCSIIRSVGHGVSLASLQYIWGCSLWSASSCLNSLMPVTSETVQIQSVEEGVLLEALVYQPTNAARQPLPVVVAGPG
jgi:hypothetical protein